MARYRAGGCSEAEAAAIQSHLARCERCRNWFVEASEGKPFQPEAPGSTNPSPAAGDESETTAGELTGDSAIGSTTGAALSLHLNDSERFALVQPEIPGYEFVRVLGRGGQAFVFEAHQTSTKRKVAIKILLEGQYAGETSRRRFAREVELVAQLRHPNIITIFDSDVTADGRPYYVMDYVRGLPLHTFVRENRLSREAVLRLMIAVCDGLHYAHQRAIVHRDLKPTNILVDAQGTPRILDFGLAKWLAAPTDPGLSKSQTFLGTLPYAAPEQTRGNPDLIDARTDVYALGVILYELFTGVRPYPTDGSMHETIRNIVDTLPLPPVEAWRTGLGAEERERLRERSATRSASHSARISCPIDRDLETIMLKALAKEPIRRYQSAAELGADIERYMQGEPIAARPDSFVYRTRKHAYRFVSRNPFATGAIILILSAVLGQMIGVPLAYYWTPSQQYYEQLVAPDRDPVAHVRIIGMKSNESLLRAAATAGVENVDPANSFTLRRLHGRMLERLLAARPAVVCFDIRFKEAHPYSDDLARGVLALREAGIDVVVATLNWPLEPDERPLITDPLLPLVRHGTAPLAEIGAWKVPVVAQRGAGIPVAALAIETLAAAEAPGAEVHLTLDRDAATLSLAYWKPDPGARGARKSAAPPRTIRLSAVEEQTEPNSKSDTKTGDLLGYVIPAVPLLEESRRATRDYEAVLAATDDERSADFRGKVVLIADMRATAEDWYEHPTLGLTHGSIAHAATIEGVLNQRLAFRLPRPVEQYLWIACGVIAGLLIGGAMRGRHAVRVLLLLVAAAALTALGMVILRYAHVTANPIPPIVGMILASEISAAAGRAARPPGSLLLERSSGT